MLLNACSLSSLKRSSRLNDKFSGWNYHILLVPMNACVIGTTHGNLIQEGDDALVTIESVPPTEIVETLGRLI